MEEHFLEDMAAQLKVVNVKIILGAIFPTAREEAAAEKCHFTYAANESTIKWLWRLKQPAVVDCKPNSGQLWLLDKAIFQLGNS